MLILLHVFNIVLCVAIAVLVVAAVRFLKEYFNKSKA